MFSKGIWKANWKRFWIVPVIASIILFLGITFQMQIEAQEIEKRARNYSYINEVIVPQTSYKSEDQGVEIMENRLEDRITIDTNTSDNIPIVMPNYDRYLRNILYNALNVVVIFILPVLLAILLYSYMNEEKSSSFMHGLPISKKRIYMTNLLTGIAMYVLPYVINLVILLIFHLGKMGNYIEQIELWRWFGINLLYNTIFFSFSVIIGMFCASKISHGILTYVFMYAPIGLLVFITRILEEIIYGFYAFSEQVEELALKIPFIKILEDFSQIRYYYENTQIKIEPKTIIIYLVVSAIMLAVGFLLYKKRKLETTKEFIAFKSIRSIIKYVATLGINLLSYAYFYAIFDESKVASIIASFLLTLIGYFIIEMILKKTYKVFKSIKGFVVYAIILLALYAIAVNGALGYETRIPQVEKVSQIAVTRNNETIVFDEIENQKRIYGLHKKIVEERKNGYHTIRIEYQLKNGKKLSRKYEISEKQYEEELKELYDSDEYREEASKVLEDTKVEKIVINLRYRTSNQRYQYKEIEIKKEDQKEFLALLRSDIKERRANIGSNYGVSEIKIPELGERVSISIRINLKENEYRFIDYTKVENMRIRAYIEE